MTRNRPLIGVPTQTLQSIDGIPPELPHSWVMNHRYYTALASVGAAPVMVPLLSDEDALRGIHDALDGIFLAGGVDVDPSSYGAERDDACGRTDLDRDRVEMLLARWARAEGKPLFGACRGMQVINVAAGGTLHQECAHLEHALKHDYFPTEGHARDFLAHSIEVAAGTRLRALFGAGDVMVNSMHHQVIDRLAGDLVVTASAPDGIIEAVEGTEDAFMVGVQWHPEMLVDADAGTRRLFQAFVDAAAAYRTVAA